MRSPSDQQQFDQLLAQTAAKRSAIRANDAYGRQADSEPSASRAAAYKDRIAAGQRNGAETRIGETLDYQGAAFLAQGAAVRRAIGLVEVNLGVGSRTGTGFLIGGRLFITNQHVISSADDAVSCTITFDRELDSQRIPLASTSFRLAPDVLFLSSPQDVLDFAVVALGARISGPTALQDLHLCPLSPAPDKHVLGMKVNIIQHPGGNYKQVAIRNNLLTWRTDHSLLYETDTEVGSSGSPVFNDNWDVVALHHYGQPYLARLGTGDDHTIPANANEGIRISAIHHALTAALAGLTHAQQALLTGALDLYKQAPSSNGALIENRQSTQFGPRTPASPGEALDVTPTGETQIKNPSGAPAVTLTLPLEITLRLLLPQTVGASSDLGSAAAPVAAAPIARPARLTRGAEAAKVDRNYDDRKGYQSDFLPGFQMPLPQPDALLARQVAPLRADQPNAAAGLLRYQHFSLKMHKTRRVAIFTATNIDGDSYRAVSRTTGKVIVNAIEADTWFKDPRISESFYLGQDFYSSTSRYFDRGHLTRRADPTWGSALEAQRANADTFHFTNCAPQHFRFNQTTPYWQGVERYILETGIAKAGPDARLCVFQGPVYDDNIDWWIDDEVQIPSSFWKVVVWRGAQGLKSVGLVVDQLQLLSEERVGLQQPQEVSHVDVSVWRVPVQDIGTRCELLFDPSLVAADTIGQQVAPQPGAEAARRIRVRGFSDIAL